MLMNTNRICIGWNFLWILFVFVFIRTFCYLFEEKNYDDYYSYSVFKTPFGHPCYLGVQTKGGLGASDDYEGWWWKYFDNMSMRMNGLGWVYDGRKQRQNVVFYSSSSNSGQAKLGAEATLSSHFIFDESSSLSQLLSHQAPSNILGYSVWPHSAPLVTVWIHEGRHQQRHVFFLWIAKLPSVYVDHQKKYTHKR